MKKEIPPDQIDVVIVEPHQHALEHIHHIIRRTYRKRRNAKRSLKKVDPQPWTVIHFDSHPDLACPNDSIPATLCFTPRRRMLSTAASLETKMKREPSVKDEEKDLYEFLDTSQSGIAEWIIPLVFSGDLNRILWIKNEWCHQFDIGNYKFHVGAWIPPSSQSLKCSTMLHSSPSTKIESFVDLPETASIKTSFCHHYYLDDDCVVQDHELHMKKQLDLIVGDLRIDPISIASTTNHAVETIPCKSDLDKISRTNIAYTSQSDNHNSNRNNQNEQKLSGGDWILDICLDYFICFNPFLVELGAIDEGISILLLKAVDHLKFRQTKGSMSSSSSSMSCFGVEIGNEYLKMSKQFHILASAFFENLSSKNELPINETLRLLDEDQYTVLYSLYPDLSIGKQIWDELTMAMIQYACNKSNDEVKKLCFKIINALPSISLPHQGEYVAFDRHYGESETLSSEILSRVKLFGQDLKHRRWEHCCTFDAKEEVKHLHAQPNLVTIARSSEDGFTPQNVVDKLQKVLLNEIQDAYSNCTLNVVLDYGEHEGSTLE